MKRVSYNLPNHAHYLTFSCYRRQKFLINDDVRLMLLTKWNEARRSQNFRIWAYVIMPEHVHLLLYPEDEHYNMAQILRLLKEPFSRWIVEHWRDESPHLLKAIEVERGERKVNRFWQEGGGYDRSLFSNEAIRKSIAYIEWNPVRRGLVDDPLDWPWSSARARVKVGETILMIDEFV